METSAELVSHAQEDIYNTVIEDLAITGISCTITSYYTSGAGFVENGTSLCIRSFGCVFVVHRGM